jgi:probable HAF family extracellular repeat protein
MVSLGRLPGDTHSVAVAINKHTHVVGYSTGQNSTCAFLWTPDGGMVSLGTLPGGDSSRALSINDHDEVVGTSESGLGNRAFVWTRGGGMKDLNSLIVAGFDFALSRAVAINDRGTVLAIGHDAGGHPGGDGDTHDDDHDTPGRVFLLDPS